MLFDGAFAHFRTGSFAKGIALVDAIGELADAANHHPDVDLRLAGVTVRTSSHDVQGLSERDVALARRISAAARELGVPPTRPAVQVVQVAIDALVTPEVRPFWRAVLGYREVGDEDLVDPRARGPSIWFQELDAPRRERNRIHVGRRGHLDGPRLIWESTTSRRCGTSPTRTLLRRPTWAHRYRRTEAL